MLSRRIEVADNGVPASKVVEPFKVVEDISTSRGQHWRRLSHSVSRPADCIKTPFICLRDQLRDLPDMGLNFRRKHFLSHVL